MKSFLKYIGGILVLMYLMMVFLDNFYSYVFQNGAPDSKIQKILNLQDKHYAFGFFGSSRTENHIDCKLIERITGKSCINLGISGGTIGDMLVLMNWTKQKGITFDHVFLQIDYSFNGRGISQNLKAELIPYFRNPLVQKIIKSDLENLSYKMVPFYRYMKFDKEVGFRQLLSTIFNNQINVEGEIGFFPLMGVSQQVIGALPKEIREKNLEVEQMRKLFKNSYTKLHFFSAPFCPDVPNRSYFDSLETKFPEIKNYSGLFDKKPHYFFNCGHLNIEGAEEFTKVLINDYRLTGLKCI